MESDSIGNIESPVPVMPFNEGVYKAVMSSLNKGKGTCDAIGPATVAESASEKGSPFSYLAMPDYKDGYRKSEGGIWMPPPSGTIPPVPLSNLYQAGKPGIPPEAEKRKGFLQIIKDEAFAGIKDSIYLAITEWPAILRRMLFDKASSMGTLPDLLSSLWAMGAYAGPIKNWETDLLCDRYEIIINQRQEALGLRLYNERKLTPFIMWLREGQKEIIPWGGRPSEFEDLDFTREGNLAHFKLDRQNAKGELLGGNPRGVDNMQYDPFYTESETLNWALHKELKKGLSPSRVQQDLLDFTLSHYVYTKGSAKLDYLGQHKETGDYIWRLTLPPASILGIKQWDPALFAKTLARVVGAYAIIHWPYYAFEKLGGYLHLPDKFIKGIAQSEVDSIFKPTIRVVDRSRG